MGITDEGHLLRVKRLLLVYLAGLNGQALRLNMDSASGALAVLDVVRLPHTSL